MHIRAALVLASLATSLPSAHAGELLVTSRFTDEVLRYDLATGAFLGVFADGGGLDNPVGLSFGPDGALYVVSADTNQVLRYDGTSGAFLDVFAGGNLLAGPRQLNFGPDGHLYVASGAGDRIVRFDGTSGAFLGIAAAGNGLDGPTSFTFGPGGDLFVGSVLTDRVLRFDGASGAFEGVFAHEHLDLPHDVAFGPDGLMYVSNAGGQEDVVRFDASSGAFVDVFVSDPQASFALGLTWTRDGGLLLANQGFDEVRRYDARSGALQHVLVSAGSGGLDGPLFTARVPEAATTTVFAFDPGLAGGSSWLAVEGARPGAEVQVFLGRGPGMQSVGGCAGLALDVSDARALGRGFADESGGLLLDRRVPLALGGHSVFLQALDRGRCETSHVVVQAIP